MTFSKDEVRGTRFVHCVDPTQLDGIEEWAWWLESILNNGAVTIFEDGDGELVLGETKALVATIERGMKIEIYPREHSPPHFHVKSAAVNAAFRIEDCSLLRGDVSKADHRKIRFWHQHSKNALIDAWNSSRPTNCPVGPYSEP